MAEKNKVEVRIAGKDYRLTGFESDEYIQRIGLYIDKKMNEVLRQNNKLSTSMAAVLTAINVADDLMKVKDSDEKNGKEIIGLNKKIRTLEEEKNRITKEKDMLSRRNTDLQLELAKREAELREVRNTLEKIPKGNTGF